MFAYQGNLCVPDDENPQAFSGPEFFNFDIAAVGLGFHVSVSSLFLEPSQAEHYGRISGWVNSQPHSMRIRQGTKRPLTLCIPTQHFDDPHLAAKRLVDRLKPGGVLMIVEFYSHGRFDTAHPAQHTVKHHGFSEEDMKDVFVKAGAGGNYGISDIGSITLLRTKEGTQEPHEMKRRLFIARGTKL